MKSILMHRVIGKQGINRIRKEKKTGSTKNNIKISESELVLWKDNKIDRYLAKLTKRKRRFKLINEWIFQSTSGYLNWYNWGSRSAIIRYGDYLSWCNMKGEEKRVKV